MQGAGLKFEVLVSSASDSLLVGKLALSNRYHAPWPEDLPDTPTEVEEG